ncbi:MAG TPA: hypothetical protein VK498_04780 [Ferruginibacter sp.]|nr:hypothetical protein [Ferruginibacter sp.]
MEFLFKQAIKLIMHNFTPEDLLQYMYKETSTEKTAAIEAALSSDWNLREKFNVLSAAHQKLNELKQVSPRKQAIDNIINYAEKSVEALSEQA